MIQYVRYILARIRGDDKWPMVIFFYIYTGAPVVGTPILGTHLLLLRGLTILRTKVNNMASRVEGLVVCL